MKHTIRWTTKERNALVAATVKLMQTGNYSLLDAFRQAQDSTISEDGELICPQNLQPESISVNN